MKKTITISLTIMLLLVVMVSAVSAANGTIRGSVYRDVNGDGLCVDTGVPGEEPVPGITLEFVSEDEQHTIHLYTGGDGMYGLAAAGFSNWRVTATPNSDWVVTSQNPIYAYINHEKVAATDVNFCVAKVGEDVLSVYPGQPVYPVVPIYPGGQQPVAQVIMPESGAPEIASNYTALLTAVIAFGGFSFIMFGVGLEVKRRRF